jgi:hypothetical protein
MRLLDHLRIWWHSRHLGRQPVKPDGSLSDREREVWRYVEWAWGDRAGTRRALVDQETSELLAKAVNGGEVW